MAGALVSIVIPCFNQGRFLERAVESCLAQTHAAVEVIVVNDGSTDDTAARIEAASRRDGNGRGRVRGLTTANAGLGAARNRGLALAQGEYVNFLDADDWLEPTKIARQLAVLESTPEVGLVLCDIQMVDETGGLIPGAPRIQLDRFHDPDNLFDVLLEAGLFPPHVPLVRRRLVEQAGRFCEDRAVSGHADYLLWLSIAAAGTRIHVLDEPLVAYRQSPHSMSADRTHMDTSRERALTLLAARWPDRVARGIIALGRQAEDLRYANRLLSEGDDSMTTTATGHDELLARISALPYDWHGAGTLPPNVLEAMVRLIGGRIRRSVETGAGKSTLLLSHLSDHHTVFAMDGGNSVSVTQASDLLNKAHVEYVDGPTQDTLRAYTFMEPLDFALIDGPHGYPFPELEYWVLYRHIRPGGLLVIDDIQIPTIHAMFEFLREEPMFTLVEVVGYTAFFRRTNTPTFDPYCDGWFEQPYNTARFPIDVPGRLGAQRPPDDKAYRDRLVPLIEEWVTAGTRVAIFGIGGHTDELFRIVPELDRLALVAFLDSNPDNETRTYRGKPVRLPAWAEGRCDIVLCSSFAHEMTQLALLDRVKVKAVPSHIQPLSRAF